MNNMNRNVVESAVSKVLTQSGRSVPALSDDLNLVRDLKLDSLDLAQVVVQLETDLGFDPFRAGGQSVQTLGELIGLYRDAAND